jgi:hypothetical protein
MFARGVTRGERCMICRWIRAVTLAAAVIAAIAARDTANAEALFSEEWREKFVKEKFRERMKHVRFNDAQETRCPTFTGLIHSAGDTFKVLVPRHIGFPGPQIIGKNLPDITLGNENCRYTITVKRFDTSSGGEREVALKKLDPWAETDKIIRRMREEQNNKREEPKAEKTVGEETGGEAKPRDPVQAVPLYNIRPQHPDETMVDRRHIEFDAPTGAINLIGLMYFAPRSFSVHIVDAAEDLDIESRKDHETKQYEVSFRNAVARVSLAITKEIYLNRWVKVFGD